MIPDKLRKLFDFMRAKSNWYKRLYGIERPSPDEVLRCAIAVCGGEVERSYLENFILKNEIDFNIDNPRSLEKYGIMCEGGICRLEDFRFDDRRRAVSKHLMDFYRF